MGPAKECARSPGHSAGSPGALLASERPSVATRCTSAAHRDRTCLATVRKQDIDAGCEEVFVNLAFRPGQERSYEHDLSVRVLSDQPLHLAGEAFRTVPIRRAPVDTHREHPWARPGQEERRENEECVAADQFACREGLRSHHGVAGQVGPHPGGDLSDGALLGSRGGLAVVDKDGIDGVALPREQVSACGRIDPPAHQYGRIPHRRESPAVSVGTSIRFLPTTHQRPRKPYLDCVRLHMRATNLLSARRASSDTPPFKFCCPPRADPRRRYQRQISLEGGKPLLSWTREISLVYRDILVLRPDAGISRHYGAK